MTKRKYWFIRMRRKLKSKEWWMRFFNLVGLFVIFGSVGFTSGVIGFVIGMWLASLWYMR
jgi:hypothetical protein